jgi:PAS domain S-box-containing protein
MKRFQAIANAARDLVWVCSPAGENIFLNARWHEYTGQTVEQAKGSGWAAAVHPDDMTWNLPHWEHCRRTGEPFEGDVRYRRLDGEYRWHISRALPERDADGNVLAWYGYSIDVHEAKVAADQLRESEARLRLATRGAGVAVWDHDLVEDRLILSAEYCAIVGLPAGTSVAMADVFGWIHPDDRDRIIDAVTTPIDPDASDTFAHDFRIHRVDTGELRWVTSVGQAFFKRQGNTRKAVRATGVLIDITDRKIRERHDQFLFRLHEAIRPLSDPAEMQDVTSRLLGEHLGVNRVLYAAIDGEEFDVTRCYSTGVAPFLGRGSILSFGAALLETGRRGESIAVSDIRSDPRFSDADRAAHLGAEIVAFAAGVLHKDGRWVAAFGVHNATPRVWTRDEITLIEETAERMWSAAEQARAITALREREGRLRLVLEASAAGSWTRTVTADDVDWDDGLRRLYGFPPGEPVTFETWMSRIHKEDREKVFELVDEMRHPTRDAWDSVFRIVRPDGTVGWIQSIGRVERDGAGEVKRLAGLELDVTARRQAEEALQARREEEHNRELRLLLETAAQGIVSVDAQGRILMANRALEAMFGWPSGDLIGQPVERLITSATGDRYGQRAAFPAAEDPRPAGTDLALVGLRKDGSEFPIEVTVSRTTTARGGHAIAFVTDVTERRQATAELEHRMGQLRRLASDLTLAEQHAREQLAKTLHDGLQQLLVTVALHLEQAIPHEARGGLGTGDPFIQAKAQLDEAIAAARSLSYELFPPVLHRSGLAAGIAWLADWTRHQYGLRVDVSADPHADPARKDVRTLLFESVRELLFNVVKHAQVDRVTVDLARTADDALRITVADHGIGFDPAALVDRARTGQVGWGLFSIRERLTLLGGRFEIDSTPGHGTTFRLIAPRGSAQADTAADPGSVTSTRRLRILIVDDHVPVRKALRGFLQARPEFQVAGEATNGLESIAKARVIKPDVILMDISMPEMDGIEATQRLHAEAPSILIFGLSMQPRTEGRHAIEEAGAAGFFTKGVDMPRLMDELLTIHQRRVAGSVAAAAGLR